MGRSRSKTPQRKVLPQPGFKPRTLMRIGERTWILTQNLLASKPPCRPPQNLRAISCRDYFPSTELNQQTVLILKRDKCFFLCACFKYHMLRAILFYYTQKKDICMADIVNTWQVTQKQSSWINIFACKGQMYFFCLR